MGKSGKSEKKEISFEKTMKNTELISYLEAIVNSLKEGKIVIEQGPQFVSLTPAAVIRVEMQTKQKKDKEKLSLDRIGAILLFIHYYNAMIKKEITTTI